MLFRLLAYMFGITTKHILDTRASGDRKNIKLSLTKLEVVKVWVINISKITSDVEVSYSFLDDFMLSEAKNELYYNFTGELIMFNHEVQIDNTYYLVSRHLGILPNREDLVISDGFILNKDKTLLYGVVSKDIGSRKLYKKLTKIKKEVK